MPFPSWNADGTADKSMASLGILRFPFRDLGLFDCRRHVSGFFNRRRREGRHVERVDEWEGRGRRAKPYDSEGLCQTVTVLAG